MAGPNDEDVLNQDQQAQAPPIAVPPTSLKLPPRYPTFAGAGANILQPDFATLGASIPGPQGNIPRTPFPVQVQQAGGVGGGGSAPGPSGLPPLPAKIPVPEPPKYTETEPMKAMGNPLTLLALVASTFVRQPAIAAGNAMAAAMEAQKKNDVVAYNEHYKEYQQEVQKVARLQQQENDEYNAIFNNYKLTHDQRVAAVRGRAAKNGDSLMMQAVAEGTADNEKAYKLYAAKAKTVEQMRLVEEAHDIVKDNPDIKFSHALTIAKKGVSDAPIGDYSKQGQEFINSLPADDRDYIMSLARGDQAMPKGKWAAPYIKAAQHLNPNLSGAAFTAKSSAERFYASGQGAQGLTAIGTVISHLGRLEGKIDALNNTDFKLANKAFQSWAAASGDPTYIGAINNIHAAVRELGRVFRGTGIVTDSEIKSHQEAIDVAMGPRQLHEAVREFVGLLEGRFDEVKYQFERTTGRKGDELISPKARETLKGLEKGGKPTIKSKEEYDALDSGVTFTGPDGKEYTKP